MVKPNVSGTPGAGPMGDTLEFMKNLWGGMGVPGMMPPGTNPAGMSMPQMAMPTLSVEEINKRISELRAVESWITLNMNMLRATIQALEVQSATISALQSMGESLNAAMTGASGQAAETKAQDAPAPDGQSSAGPESGSQPRVDAAAFTAPLANATAWWNMLQDQFKQAVNQAMAQAQTQAGMDGSSASQSDQAAQGDAAPKRKSPKH
ncbi:PhaM family polyhydroxyalkanoate granule multifunctional regulatory protein [Noviherbaspirillum massiliense]|uniref:PhaM family polyhydroxyalkanoate granule multifunctional regulatory protein n=1 Tax=Noviherbaspirillum massiliense TaxID=1465823 RepID=UPI00030F0075|nr:PhaM family polyhydroxyalkanoate granule multifunctional regulatory protein [Noviherbaspirillum massiliense]